MVVDPDPPIVVAIMGPTGVGKSAVAHEVAMLLDGEIVSADSMQVYRGMDVGTAKPKLDGEIRYHCVDLVEPGTPFSAAMYQQEARQAISDICNRGRVPILVGGTGLYMRATLEDFRFPAGRMDSPIRVALEEDARRLGSRALHERLRRQDPDSAARIHPNNVRRVIRALEMAAEGVSYSQRCAEFVTHKDIYRAVRFGLSREREILYAAIDARVQSMLSAGLLDEVKALVDAGYSEALTSIQAIGYKEFVPVLEGTVDLKDATAAVAQATRRYAKRQLSWLRGDKRIQWIDMTDIDVDVCAHRIVTAVAATRAVL